jgi:integrase/recombinase XerC
VTNPNPPAASQQAAVQAALLILERMGLSPGDLTSVRSDRKPVPTFAEYVPVVSAAVTDGTRKAYGSYWNRVTEQWGGRRLDEPTPSEIRQLMKHVRSHVVPRRNARGGRGAAENLVAALRCLYRHAEDDGLIGERDNPARKVGKPRRLPSTRRAVADTRLAEINQVAATTGDDPELDTLILRLHTETTCRRGGALALRPQDLDREQCLVLLREKGETVRWQPVSPTLMAGLARHAEERHAPPDRRLLRYSDGRPVTYRRYDGLWVRIGRYLPWARTQQISTHWLRHTTLTWVERNFGFAVAHAYAGHTDGGSDTGTATSTYVRATLAEVATALASPRPRFRRQRRSTCESSPGLLTAWPRGRPPRVAAPTPSGPARPTGRRPRSAWSDSRSRRSGLPATGGGGPPPGSPSPRQRKPSTMACGLWSSCSGARSPGCKETWLRDAREVSVQAAYAFARTGAAAAASAALERGRALLLSEALQRDRAEVERLADMGRADLQQRYQAAVSRWNRLSRTSDRSDLAKID